VNGNGSVRIEITLASRDETLIEDAITALGPVEVSRGRTARVLDPITVLTVVGTATSLVNGLLALRDRLAKDKSDPSVKIGNAKGRRQELSEMDRKDLEDLMP
jgi:hypothetical protein